MAGVGFAVSGPLVSFHFAELRPGIARSISLGPPSYPLVAFRKFRHKHAPTNLVLVLAEERYRDQGRILDSLDLGPVAPRWRYRRRWPAVLLIYVYVQQFAQTFRKSFHVFTCIYVHMYMYMSIYVD